MIASKHPIYKSYAKVNVFLKIVGYEEGYHQISSRFIRLNDLHDTMWFELGNGYDLDIVGDFSCDKEDNTIYKAYKALLKEYPQKAISEFGKSHKVVVYKNIPAFAGLGGGSSNAATFLMMMNETLKLGLSTQDLIKVGVNVGADVAFFLSGYESANVSGFGQIIEKFDEELPDLEFYTPDLECSTPAVYRSYRRFYKNQMEENSELSQKLEQMESIDILKKYDPELLNDLFKAAIKLDPEILFEQKEGYFFSGSGSSFFRLKEK
jgi:4-diphosphocytidyl-2-C-methyl-D-erythritol kinase